MIDRAYLERLTGRRGEIEAEMSRPETAGDAARMQALMREYSRLKDLIAVAEQYLSLSEQHEESLAVLEDPATEPELRELAEEQRLESEKALPAAERNLQLALLEPDPMDEKPVIVEIRAGTGGEEAALFTADLYKMYSRYAENAGWRTSIISTSDSDAGGYKEIVFGVEDAAAYRWMKYESGTHRVQRVPETETQGRIHTSAATVAVLPEAEEVDIEINPQDLKIDTYRASGAGGQHVNTTDSAVRITHEPSGLIVQCQDERSQHKNRAKALKVLRSKLLDHQRREDEMRAAEMRKSQVGSGDRSEKIRTYNFPQNRVTDHRINLTLYKLDRIMAGELAELIETLRERDLEKRIEAEVQTATPQNGSS
ncbi:peptide chain release factor 1 [Kiritimatiella glycovorans]|uniref:Peptide chain release factor 1 n=1 Tax=Kiritimatiella glycovorans TaxID=1307763 RepID=A0A0G3EGR6_9BACT|nr:peptide chain release factor 1 [Kiritimatiella glycovorans]AKJ63314.1 Peptide chain release factor 1 [Kiritimatiella glycovorans]